MTTTVVVVMMKMKMESTMMMLWIDIFLVAHSDDSDIGAFEQPLRSELLGEDQTINVTLSAEGEISQASFCLHALQNATVSSFLLQGFDGLELELSWVRYKLKRRTMDGSVYSFEPLLLDPFHPLHFQQGMSRRLWVQVARSPGGSRGCEEREIRGSVVLVLSSTAELKINIVVRSLPFPLPWVDDLLLGWLGTAVSYPQTSFPEVRAKQEEETSKSVLLLRSYGSTGVTGGGGGPTLLGLKEGGGVEMEFEEADASMAVIRESFGRREVNSYAGLSVRGIDMYAPRTTSAMGGRRYEDVMAEVVQEIRQHARDHDWPEYTMNVGDEPSGGAIDSSIQVARAIRRGGGRTSVFTSLSDVGDERSALIDEVDLLILTLHSGGTRSSLRAN
eukprot:253129-Hanusia_phi.AAC.1